DLQLRLDAATENRITPKQASVPFSETGRSSGPRQKPSQVESDDPSSESSESPESTTRRRGLLRRERRVDKPTKPQQAEPADQGDEEAKVESAKTKRRGWFRRGAKVADEAAETDDSHESTSEVDANDRVTRRRSRFSLFRKPDPDAESAEDTDPPTEMQRDQNSDASSEPPKKRGWLSGLRRKPPVHSEAPDPSATEEPAKPAVSANRPERPSRTEEIDDAADDSDEIDWSSMSKAERRRMRRKMKRGGRAA
ncbi:MAG: hypothetical protein AAGJ83_10275, partial [Planctomycetota bacterium]